MDTPAQDTVGTKIAKAIIKAQTEFAKRMNKKVSGVSMRKLKIGLAFFCLLSAGTSIYVALNAVLENDKVNSSFKIDQTSVPKHFDKTGDEARDVQNELNVELYHQIKTFKVYMDSLKRNAKAEYDSIIISRPGLMDSIKMLEQIYLSQQIK